MLCHLHRQNLGVFRGEPDFYRWHFEMIYWFVILSPASLSGHLPTRMAHAVDQNLEILFQLVDFGVHSSVDSTIHGSWNSFFVEELIDLYNSAPVSFSHPAILLY